MEENTLNKRSHVFQRQKSHKSFSKENEKKSNKVWVVKTEKPNVESKTEENNEKFYLMITVVKRLKFMLSKRRTIQPHKKVPFKNQNEKFQNQNEKVEKSDLRNEISGKKAQNKAYWKLQKEKQKAKFLRYKNNQNSKKTFS